MSKQESGDKSGAPGAKTLVESRENGDRWPKEFLDCLGAWGENIPRPSSERLDCARQLD